MFENLLNLVKEHAGDAIINNPAIPNEKNDDAVSTVTHSIMNSLKKQVASGNVSDIAGLLSGNSSVTNSPVVNKLSSDAINDLTSKFGISGTQASGIIASLLPVVLKKLIHKTNDANDNSFDIGSIFGSLTGNSGFDIGSVLKQVTGGSTNSSEDKGGLGGMLGKVFGG